MALKLWRLWHTLGSGLIVLIVLAAFVRLGYVIADSVADPFVVTETRVLTPMVHTGEPIKVQFTVQRRRLCTTMISQFWIDRATGEAMHRDRIPGGYTPIGIRQTLVTLHPPVALPPGSYSYRSVMESDCGLATFVFRVPDAEFEVVDR